MSVYVECHACIIALSLWYLVMFVRLWCSTAHVKTKWQVNMMRFLFSWVIASCTRYAVSYCWQTSFVIWTHLSPTGEHTCFAGTSTVNRSPHRHSSRCWLEAPAGSSTEKLVAAIGRRHRPICWCCLDRGPGSFDVEDATTLQLVKRSSEWVSECMCQICLHTLFIISLLND